MLVTALAKAASSRELFLMLNLLSGLAAAAAILVVCWNSLAAVAMAKDEAGTGTVFMAYFGLRVVALLLM